MIIFDIRKSFVMIYQFYLPNKEAGCHGYKQVGAIICYWQTNNEILQDLNRMKIFPLCFHANQ